MSLQLIFVVETNKTCKSDWIYIKDTIDYFLSMIEQQLNSLQSIWMERENTKIKKKKFQKILLHIRREEKDDRRK